MNPHWRIDEEARDKAALYSLGALPRAEADQFAAHIDLCGLCRDEVTAQREAVAALGHLAPEVDPPPQLKARLLAHIRALKAARAAIRTDEPRMQPWKEWAGSLLGAAFHLSRASEAAWEPTAVLGVSTRRLYVDAAADRVTMLVRMEPGSAYPGHRHANVEECYVIEGDLRVGEFVMTTGDYQRVGAGELHGVQSTINGCTLLIVSSLRDEIVDPGLAAR